MATATVSASRRHVVRLIAVWPGDDTVVPCYDGTQVVMPPRNVVAVPYDKNKPETHATVFRFAAARDHNGVPMPGTILLETDIRPDPATAGMRTEFDALQWTDGLLGANGLPGTAQGKALVARGFDIVDSPEEVPAAMERGRKKWEALQRLEWMAILDVEQARRKELADKNQRYVPSANDAKVRAAHAGLVAMNAQAEHAAISDEDLFSVLGGAPKPAPSLAVVTTPKPQDDIENKDVGLQMIDDAESLKVYITKAEILGCIRHEPAMMAAVQAKIEKSLAGDAPEETASA